MAGSDIWREEVRGDFGDTPLVACAVHAGHAVREDVSAELAIGDADRLREEDPFTGEWTAVAPTRFVGLRSRFEVDLNRPRETAIYRRPEDAWGLRVWRSGPPGTLVARSLESYDAFYARVGDVLGGVAARFGRFVVFDLHSYNHRRAGPAAAPADEAFNPQVNLGTGSVDRLRWGRVLDRFIHDLRGFDFPSGPLDVRENVKFQGGNFPRWVNGTFRGGCALAIEFKKFFMDEWTGQADPALVAAITDALRSTANGVLGELEHVQ